MAVESDLVAELGARRSIGRHLIDSASASFRDALLYARPPDGLPRQPARRSARRASARAAARPQLRRDRAAAVDRSRAVRERALSALDALGPADRRVPAERRAEISDYLLGQLPSARLSEDPRAAGRVPTERAWARVVASELAPLAASAAAGDPGRVDRATVRAVRRRERAGPGHPPSPSPSPPPPPSPSAAGAPSRAPRPSDRRSRGPGWVRASARAAQLALGGAILLGAALWWRDRGRGRDLLVSTAVAGKHTSSRTATATATTRRARRPRASATSTTAARRSPRSTSTSPTHNKKLAGRRRGPQAGHHRGNRDRRSERAAKHQARRVRGVAVQLAVRQPHPRASSTRAWAPTAALDRGRRCRRTRATTSS